MEILNINFLGSSICNLQCSYCYVPKVKELKSIHDNVNIGIKNGSIVKHLNEKYVLDKVTSIGFWGAEPTLNLDNSFIFLSDMMKTSPIREVFIPTNFTTNPDLLVSFIEKIGRIVKEKFKIRIQISLDGPDFITDVNRGEKVTGRILENVENFIKKLNVSKDIDNVEINIFVKSTWSAKNLTYLSEHLDKINDVKVFFEEINTQFNDMNKRKNVFVNLKASGNMETPGNYNTDDGKNFAIVLDRMGQIGSNIAIFGTFMSALKKVLESRNLFSRPDYFTCSSVRNSISIGDNWKSHLCHRTFHIKYDDSAKHQKEFTDKFIDNIVDERSVNYLISTYHYFSALRLNLTANTAMELAYNGQIYNKYRNIDYAFLLSMLVDVAICCPLENLLENFSVNSNPASSVRLFGNGALDVLIKYYKERYGS